jgi:long-chain fatty acid transport protein
MKNIMRSLMLFALLIPATTMAGGIVTNTNQSASFIRKPVQDAVINATGTYYNPAGLAFLADGFHFSFNNQTITQTRRINSTFPTLTNPDFEAGVSAPIFPAVYGVYKSGSFALSFGVNPIGGGGSANYENGLPSFETQVSMLPAGLTAAGINTTAYALDAAFDGKSVNWGLQANGSYAINDVLSFSLGLRYIMANNSYKGHLRDITINPAHPLNAQGSGNMVSAPLFFNTVASVANTASQGLQLFIDQGASSMTLDQLIAIGALNTTQKAQIAGGLGASYNDNLSVAQIQGAYKGIATQMTGLANSTQDRELDATQSGTGISPIIGMNIRFNEDLNFAIKYEHKASMTMTNSTTRDDVGLYPDGIEVASDMPSMLAAGLNYRATRELTLSGGVHYYFDKNADYGRSIPNDELIDKNFWEAGVGLEYMFSRSFGASAGYLRAQSGVNDSFHSDLNHSLSSNSVGAGVIYFINPNMAINFGAMSTVNQPYTKSFAAATGMPEYTETYNRRSFTVAIGLDFKF